MATITVQKISRRAKSIRRKGEKWIHAIKRASAELKKNSGTVGRSSTPGKKSAGRKTVPKKKKGYSPRKPTHQTGTSSKNIDKRIKAKPPGRRTVKSSSGKKHNYYEYRKNRSDMPGKLTGVSSAIDGSAYRQMILGHMKEADRVRSNAEKEILRLKQMKRNTSPKEKLKRKMIDSAIKQQRAFVSSQKKEISMLKTLYK